VLTYTELRVYRVRQYFALTITLERRTAPMRVAMLSAAVHALGCVLTAASGFGWGAALADGGSARTREVRCDAQDVSVRSPDPADTKVACEGARDAIGFLAAQGFNVVSDISIDLVPKLPRAAGASAAGCYMESERRVLILTFWEFKKFKTWLNVPIDTSLYRSLVAHEVAHALGACNFKVATPSIQAKEYIAYVTMLATMAPKQRERVLSQFPGQGFEGDWQMNTTIYLVDPMRFGVQAYRHFLKPANGRDYLHAILAGKVMLE
jgi:hypothetical protein